MRKAFVFVVDGNSYPVHRDRLFCGVKNPESLMTKYELYADLLSTRPGDIVFFYQMRIGEAKHERGFRGVFQIKSTPFYDPQTIKGIERSPNSVWQSSHEHQVLGRCPSCNCAFSEKVNSKTKQMYCVGCDWELPHHILPNRLLIGIDTLYEQEAKESVIDDNTAYIDRTYIDIEKKLPVLWTMLFRKTSGAGRARSVNPILPIESDKLLYIFQDKFQKCSTPLHAKAYPGTERKTLHLDIKPLNKRGALQYESLLMAWIMKNIDTPIPVFSDYVTPHDMSYFANNLLYGIGGENIDILTMHGTATSIDKINLIELKKDALDANDLVQLLSYTKWASQLIFGNDDDKNMQKIQPVLIGNRVKKGWTPDAYGTRTRSPVILCYCVENDTIFFKKPQ